jgi:hypothetical protein
MTDRIQVGTMLIQDGTRMPPTVVVVSTEHYVAGWSSIMGSTSAQLGRRIEKAGWTFFYMAGEIRSSAFGFRDQSREARGIQHLIDAVKLENCNCFEITQVRPGSFLGLPYTSLVAHARHIQESCSFYDLSKLPARMPFSSQDWLYDRPANLRSDESLQNAQPGSPTSVKQTSTLAEVVHAN